MRRVSRGRFHEESVEATIPPPAHKAPEGLWEDELDDCVHAGVEIRDWATLRDQIKKDMGKGPRSLPVSTVNQLLIIRNFATLHLKGYNQIDASLEIACQWHKGEDVHFA